MCPRVGESEVVGEADVEDEATAVVGELEVSAVEVEAGADAYASVAEACEGIEARCGTQRR